MVWYNRKDDRRNICLEIHSMETKKYNYTLEYILFALLLIFYVIITFILFKNQAVNGVIYHESNFEIDRFHSDMYAYMQEMQGLESGYNFPYPIFFKISALFNLFFSPENSVAIATCLLNAIAVVISKITINRFVIGELKKQNNEEPDNKTKLITGIVVDFVVLALFFASMLVPPHFYFGTKFRYLGVFSPNPYQNATYMAARPFAIISFLYFIKLIGEYEELKKENIKDYIIFAVIFLLSTMTKPSFTIVLGMAAVILIFFRFFKNKCKTFKASIIMGLIFIPTLIDLLYQFKGVFMPDGQEDSGVGLCLGRIWLLYTNNMASSILLAMMFPIVVLIFNFNLLKEDYRFRFAWFFYFVSYFITFCFYEKGWRAVDFNFSWSYMYGLFFSFYAAIIVMIKDLMNRKRRLIGLAELLVFLGHLASGIWYFGQIFVGNSYY